jgi:hypothetical protein
VPAAQGTAARLIEVATAEIGTIEGPKDNQTSYGAFTKANFLPWCGSFVMWCANKAGVKVPNTVSTVAGSDAFKKQKRWYENDGVNVPEAGDIVFFDFPGDGVDRISHVGIITKVNAKSGIIISIEGNTSGNAKGDQRNGGETCKKERGYRKNNAKKLLVGIVGWGRPDYVGSTASPVAPKVAKVVVTDPLVYPGETIDPGESGIHIKTIQRKLGVSKPDGIYGPVTKKAIIAFQKSLKNIGEANGVVGPKTWNAIIKEGGKS